MARRKRAHNFLGLASIWREAGPTSRLIIGTALVVAIGLLGLTPKTLLGTQLTWPFAAMVAAVGWGRSGLGFRPMFLLILLGFAQDVSADAPLGTFGFINLCAFGLSSLISGVFDRERSPFITTIAPIFLYAAGFAIVWLFASFTSGHLVQFSPLVNAFIVTYITHVLIAPIFDLGRRVSPMVGSMA